MELTLAHYLVLGAIMFAISVVGIFLNRKNVIIILMSIELILNSVNINLVAFSSLWQNAVGQVFVIFVICVAAAEAVITEHWAKKDAAVKAEPPKTPAAAAAPTDEEAQRLFTSAQQGGKAPTIIVSRDDQYARYWGIVQAKQNFYVQAGGHDEQLASAGFTNLLFNNVPWVTDSHVPDGTGSSNSEIYMLNEEYIDLCVSPRADFRLDDFQKPHNQDAMVSNLYWAGELGVKNCARHSKATDVDTV